MVEMPFINTIPIVNILLNFNKRKFGDVSSLWKLSKPTAYRHTHIYTNTHPA